MGSRQSISNASCFSLLTQSNAILCSSSTTQGSRSVISARGAHTCTAHDRKLEVTHRLAGMCSSPGVEQAQSTLHIRRVLIALRQSEKSGTLSDYEESVSWWLEQRRGGCFV